MLLSLVISLWSEMLAESASPQDLSVWEWTEGKKYKEKARAKKKKKKQGHLVIGEHHYSSLVGSCLFGQPQPEPLLCFLQCM